MSTSNVIPALIFSKNKKVIFLASLFPAWDILEWALWNNREKTEKLNGMGLNHQLGYDKRPYGPDRKLLVNRK